MRFFLTCLSLALSLCLCPGPGHAKENAQTATQADAQPAPGEIITRLPNGLLVYILRDARFPLACTRLYVRAGSANEKPDEAGISHVLEHMVFKGTSHRPKGQVAKDVEALGGYLNAATSFDKTWYLTDMPAAHWRVGMDVVHDMAFQATLNAAELETEKNVVISELQRGEDSPQRKLYENLQVAALKNTPYGRPIIGFEDTIRSITVDDLRAYVAKWYQPQNMMLLVAGDIEPAAVLEYAQKQYGSLKNTSDLAVAEPIDLDAAATGSQQVEIGTGPWSKVYLGIGIPVPGLHDLRSTDIDILCYLLGGDGTSTFYQKYKYEKQLVESISVDNMSMARAGLLSITAVLDPAKVEDFWRELTTDLGKLTAKSFNEAALARAKFNIEDSMDRAGETLNGLVAWKGSVQFDLGGEQGEENLRFTQKNVDFPQIQTAITNWLDSTNARVRVLAPQDAKLPDFAAVMEKNWPAAVQAIKTEKHEKGAGSPEFVDLGNGCSLILLPDNSAPYISLDFMLPGGNCMLEPAQQGLAALVARLLTDGSGDKNNVAMERWLAERAGSISARAGLQTFGISLTGPSRFNMDFFGLFKDIIRKPRFDPAELKREVDNMKAAIRQRKDQPLAYVFANLNPFLFPENQPYGYDSLGSDASLDSFNVISVRDFWTRQAAQPWVLAIAGDFKRDMALAFAKSLPVPHSDRFVAGQPHWGANHTLNLDLPGRNQAHYMQIFRTVPPTSEDAPALMLLQSIISGQSGILFTRLRDEQGLGYTVTAFNRSMPQTGFMAFYIGTTPDKIASAKEGFAKIITEICTRPFDAATLKTGANRLLGDYLRDRQSLASRAGEAATDKILDYPADFQKMLVEKAAQVSPQQLMHVAKRYLVEPYEVTLLP